MLNNLPPTAQLFARTALYSSNPAEFYDFAEALLPEPAVPEPLFIRMQSYEEQRLNWVNGRAREEIRQATLNRKRYENEDEETAASLATKAYRRDCAFVQRFMRVSAENAAILVRMANFESSRVDISTHLVDFCTKWEQIEGFPVSNDILWRFTADELKLVRTTPKQELGARAFIASLLKEPSQPSERNFDELMSKNADVYETIALKVEQAMYTMKTEKIEDKKKKEPEIVHEWVEDDSRYCNPLETRTSIDETLDLAHFLYFVTEHELSGQCNEEQTHPVYYYQYLEPLEHREPPCVVAVVSQSAFPDDLALFELLGKVEFLKYESNIAIRIASSACPFVVVHSVPANTEALSEMDESLERLFRDPIDDLPELQFTAFTRIVVRRFDAYEDYVKANLGHVYQVERLEEGIDYNNLLVEQIKELHPEMMEITAFDDILRAKETGNAIFYNATRDLLTEWNDFEDFVDNCKQIYDNRRPNFSFEHSLSDCVIFDDFEVAGTIEGILLERNENISIPYMKIASLKDFGDEMMQNYCNLHDIHYNTEKYEFFRRKELELAEMDPKKRPAAKKAEKISWQPQSFANSLELLCGNAQLLKFAKEFELERLKAKKSLEDFKVYIFIAQLLIHYQKEEDFAALNSNVESQFVEQFQAVIDEFNGVLSYCCALSPEQREHELLIADELITLHTIVQQALDSFEELYTRTATEFKESAESILQINKKIPEGAIQYCEEILALHTGDAIDEPSTARDGSAKPKTQAVKVVFNYKDVKLSNFNEYISIFFVFIAKKLLEAIRAMQASYISAYKFIVYFTALHSNLPFVFPTSQDDLPKIGAKSAKIIESQVKEYTADVMATLIDELAPADGVSLDRYLMSIEKLCDKLPNAYPRSIYVVETGECVSVKLNTQCENILSELRQGISLRAASELEHIRSLLTGYSEGIVGVIKQTLMAEETQFTNCEQAIGQIGQLIEKQLQTREFVERIEIIGQYEVVLHKERLVEVIEEVDIADEPLPAADSEEYCQIETKTE